MINMMGSDLDRSDLSEFLEWTASYDDNPLPWEPLPHYVFPQVEEREIYPVDEEEEEQPEPEPIPEPASANSAPM